MMDETKHGNWLFARFSLVLNRVHDFLIEIGLLDTFKSVGGFLLLLYRIVAILFMQAVITIYGRLDNTQSGGSYV
jgi:hypothetical protein